MLKNGISIGEINGRWAILFKIGLAIQPFIFAWCIWVSFEIFNIREWKASVENSHPPQWIVEKIARLTDEQDRLRKYHVPR